MYLKPTKALTDAQILQSHVDPSTIAEDFIVHELIKMFPSGDTEFHDKVRFFVREYRKHYSEDRFWRLVAALSETYMFKSYYRMLKGNQHKWIKANIPMERIKTPMLRHNGTLIGELMVKHDSSPLRVGEELRKMPWEERTKILEPFDFHRDNTPIVAEVQGEEIVVLDGSRRTVNAGIYDMKYIEAYVGVPLEDGKPALREDFVADLMKVLRDSNQVDDTLVFSFANILKEFKKNYLNGPKLIDDYVKGALGDIKNKEHAALLEEVLETSPEEKDKGKNGHSTTKASNLRKQNKPLYS